MHILHLGTLRDIIASVTVDWLQSKAYKLLGTCTMVNSVSICWNLIILNFPWVVNETQVIFASQALPARHVLISQPVNSHMLLRFYDLPVNADIDQVLHRFTYCAKEWARNHRQDRQFIGFWV